MNKAKTHKRVTHENHVFCEYVGDKSIKEQNNNLINWDDVCNELSANGKSTIVTDIDGSIFNKTAEKRSELGDIFVFDVRDFSDVSTSINPILEIEPGHRSLNQSKMLANSIITMPKSRDVSEYCWQEKAREWITAMILYIYYYEKDENKNLSYLFTLLNLGTHKEDDSDAPGFGDLMADCNELTVEPWWGDLTDNKDEVDVIKSIVTDVGINAIEMNDREAASIISTICRTIYYLKDARLNKIIGKSAFSLRNFIHSKKIQTLYIQSSYYNRYTKLIDVIYKQANSILKFHEFSGEQQELNIKNLAGKIKISN